MAPTLKYNLLNIMNRNTSGDILLRWLLICTPCSLQTALQLPKWKAKNHQEKWKHTGEKRKVGSCQGWSAIFFMDWKWKALSILQNMKLKLQEQIVVIIPYIILLSDTINSSAKLLKFNSSTVYLEIAVSIITRGSQQDHISPIVLGVVQTCICQGIKRPSLLRSCLQTAPWRVCNIKLCSVNGISHSRSLTLQESHCRTRA